MFTRQSLEIVDGFTTESGINLPPFEIIYHSLGPLNKNRSNVVWICHTPTGSSDPFNWWPSLFQRNCPFDPNNQFIICVNIPGSSYGTLNPVEHVSPDRPFSDFPLFTIRDMVRMFDLVRQHLQITKIHTLIGPSMGGFQALEWAIESPDQIDHLVLISTSAKTSPWSIALNETQRWAIEQDVTWGSNEVASGNEGLKLARAIALLSLRSPISYNHLEEVEFSLDKPKEAALYQRQVGDEICKRFNSYSYYSISRSFDSHDVGRARGGTTKALSQINAKTLIIHFTGDKLITREEQMVLSNGIKNSSMVEINGAHGHIGFLLNTKQVNDTIALFLND